MPSSSDSSSWYISIAQSGPLLLMQHLHPTLAFKPLILFPSTLYLLPLRPHHRLMLLDVSLYLYFLFPSLTPSGFFNKMLGVFKPGALNYYTLFRLIPLTLYISRNRTLIYLPLFRSLDSLLCDPMAPTPGLVFFPTDVADASGGVIIFVKQGLSFSELSTSFISSLDPYSDYIEVNISLNNFSSLSFLNVYAPSIRSSTKDSRTNFFSFSILPSYVEAEAVDFSRFRFCFHRKRTASTTSASTLLPTLFKSMSDSLSVLINGQRLYNVHRNYGLPLLKLSLLLSQMFER